MFEEKKIVSIHGILTFQYILFNIVYLSSSTLSQTFSPINKARLSQCRALPFKIEFIVGYTSKNKEHTVVVFVTSFKSVILVNDSLVFKFHKASSL